VVVSGGGTHISLVDRRGIIEIGITKQIVRLGSRSQDDLIAGYSIEEQEKMHAASQQYVPT
jgi:molecular chaperone DnaK (HSP70)